MILRLSGIAAILFLYSCLFLSPSLLFPPKVSGADPFTVRLEPIYKDSETGTYSAFSIVNTGIELASYGVHFYWPNDAYVSGDNFQLQPGERLRYDLRTAPINEDSFAGYVIISSDQPFTALLYAPLPPEPECSFFVIPNQIGGCAAVCL